MEIEMTSRIIGTGSSLPKSVVTNDFLSTIMDTSDEWISSRTGIRERHLVQDETTASLSIEAAKAALAEAGVEPEELDMIVVGTLTGDYVTPSTACEVQAGLGAVNAVAFDINAACAGFIFGLHTVNAYIRSGMCRLALVIGAESLPELWIGPTEVHAFCLETAPAQRSSGLRKPAWWHMTRAVTEKRGNISPVRTGPTTIL
jgi:3-oxoacyl-[acyl-carrier-protein] synthase-3